jgi:hypothetical protein
VARSVRQGAYSLSVTLPIVPLGWGPGAALRNTGLRTTAEVSEPFVKGVKTKDLTRRKLATKPVHLGEIRPQIAKMRWGAHVLRPLRVLVAATTLWPVNMPRNKMTLIAAVLVLFIVGGVIFAVASGGNNTPTTSLAPAHSRSPGPHVLPGKP